MGQSETFNYLLLPILKKLIQNGIKSEIIYTGNMSKKFKRANKLQASYAIILGEEEVSKKVLKVKDLTSGKEELLNLSQVLLKVTNCWLFGVKFEFRKQNRQNCS